MDGDAECHFDCRGRVADAGSQTSCDTLTHPNSGWEIMTHRSMLRGLQFLIFALCAWRADAQVLVQGEVRAHDGSLLPAAQVQLLNAANEPIAAAAADRAGRFTLRAAQAGLLRLQLAGPLHRQSEALILTDRPLTISVRAQLSNPEYAEPLSDLTLITPDPKSPLNGTPLARQSDGTYAANLVTSAPEVLLAIAGVVKNGPPIALPGAVGYRCLANLHCFAVVHPAAGQLRVVFDAKLLVRTSQPFSIRYDSPDSPSARAGTILDAAEEFNTALRVARQDTALKSGRALNQVAVERPSAERVARVIREIAQERVPLVRHAKLFEYLLLVFLEAPPDRALVRQALGELTPGSPLWALNFGNVAGAAIIASGDPDHYVDYSMKMMDAQPTQTLKGTVAAGVISAFGTSGHIGGAARLIEKARAEVGDQSMVKRVLTQFSLEGRVLPGKQAPAFRASSLDDPAVVYTEGSLKGRLYLIDFWATWCSPCIAEFPGLTKLYEKYRSRGFEILSYSIDTNADLVRQFRKARFPMPWLHAIDPELRELQSPMAKDFDVIAIPHPVLVDPTGTIIAVDEDCRGSKLEELLARLLPGGH